MRTGVLAAETKHLGNYLQQITLLTDADEKDPNADTVKLMSIHAAKGLEFSCVFAAGLEEMLFPNAMAINTRKNKKRRGGYSMLSSPGPSKNYGSLTPIPAIALATWSRTNPAVSSRKSRLNT